MLHQNQPQSRLILTRQVKDTNTSHEQKKQLENSMNYSKVKVNADSSPNLNSLKHSSFLSPKGEQKQDPKLNNYQVKATISPSSNIKSINYLEMIKEIKQQPAEDKNNFILVKYLQESEGQSKQTKMEKCQTLPATLKTQLVNNLVGCPAQLATESKAENTISSTQKETISFNKNQSVILNWDKSFDFETYKTNEIKQSFSYIPKAREEVISYKEVRLSPHKYSNSELNLKRFESPVTTRNYEEQDIYVSNKGLQTPSFNRCARLNDKNYPKLYDELYASSFQYPEYEDPVLEKEHRYEIVDDQPLQIKRDNYLSFAHNLSFKKETIYTNSNCIIQDSSKATYFGDYFTKKEQQNEKRVKTQKVSYIPTSEEIKNNLTQSKILFVPLSAQTIQTPKTNLSTSIILENKSTFNSPQSGLQYYQYPTYSSIISPNNFNSTIYSNENFKSVQSQLTILDKLPESLTSTNIQATSLKDSAKSYSSSFLSQSCISSAATTSQSTSTNNTSPLGLKDSNVQQYLKTNSIPDYKPLTNQYSSPSYSKNPLSNCQNYITNYLTSPQSNENYPLKSFLKTQNENEQIKNKKSFLNEKRENQQTSSLLFKAQN